MDAPYLHMDPSDLYPACSSYTPLDGVRACRTCGKGLEHHNKEDMTATDMTIEQLAKKSIFDRGVFEQDADKIVEAFKASPLGAPLSRSWNQKIADYHPRLIPTLLVPLHAFAYEWIGEHQPEAWYREMFNPHTQKVGRWPGGEG